MAGPGAQLRSFSLMSQQRQLQRPPLQLPLLVRASVTLNGRRFHTFIHEGASAEQLIEKVAKENGGGVAKVFYPEYGTHEIVAVKIGDQLLVKGDPKRVSEGDFSQFEDADFVKSAAISASFNSKGGIHFFVGSDGIPMTAGENEQLVFPNAEELRVSSNINDLSLSVVRYNADPLTLMDLDGMYKKGTRISKAAHEEIKSAHGDDRTSKIVLTDTSVLILGRETGEIKTASEFASDIRAEGFAYRTQYSLKAITIPKHQQQVQQGLILPTDLGPMHIPLDGSSHRVPYLYVKLFDGKVSDEVKVTVYPLDSRTEMPKQPKNMEMRMQVKAQPVIIKKTIERPQIIIKPIQKAPPAKLLFPGAPRPPKIKTGKVPFPEPKAEMKRQSEPPKIEKMPKQIKLQKMKVQQLTLPTKPEKIRIDKPPEPKKAKPEKKALEASSPKPRKKKRKAAKKELSRRKEGPKKKARPKERLSKPRTFKKKPKRFRTSLSAPKTDRLKPEKEKKIKKVPRKKPQKELLRKPRKAETEPKTKKKRNLLSIRKKKKLHPYYFNSMMGLFTSRRGRTRAGSSGRRRPASRT